MTELKCGSCGTELPPGTNFCRRCGSSIDETSVGSSEQPTAILRNVGSATTQRLDPRGTSPTRTPVTSVSSRRNAIVGGFILLLIVGMITAIAIVRLRSWGSNPAATNSQLIYPGASTVVDMTNPDGSRTVHLRTFDPLAKVENWYQNNLKLTKTMKLTLTSYVLKNEQTTITLAVEDDKTNILIKQKP